MIKVAHEKPASETGRKRLYYEITPKGRCAMEEDLQIWLSIEQGMRLVLGDAHAAS